MRAVIQRVSSASVSVDGREIARIGNGLLVLAACAAGDDASDFEWTAEKLTTLRMFPSGESHFDKSVRDVAGEILCVSQFTLLGDARKGRRPSFSAAMPVAEARAAFETFLDILRTKGVPVQSGEFQAMMDVSLTNEGPVTIIIDSKEK